MRKVVKPKEQDEENLEIEENEEDPSYIRMVLSIIIDGLISGMGIIFGGQSLIGLMCGQLRNEVYVTAIGTGNAYYIWLNSIFYGF